MLLVSNGEKILSNLNMVVRGKVKSENRSLPVTVRVSKTRVLKLLIVTEQYRVWSFRPPSPPPTPSPPLGGCSQASKLVPSNSRQITTHGNLPHGRLI